MKRDPVSREDDNALEGVWPRAVEVRVRLSDTETVSVDGRAAVRSESRVDREAWSAPQAGQNRLSAGRA